MSSVVVAATALLASVGGELTWGGIEPHPAVVNPVVEQPAADVVSLRGTWKFARPERERPHRTGVWGKFFLAEWPDARDIQGPACWEAQGIGEPGDGECWDPKWDNCQKPISHKYMGNGWYRKDVEIPAAWAGKRIWIKFGGLRSVGWVWVNGRQVALIDNYCATVKYEITGFVKPGETARVVVQVDNRKPSRKGLVSIVHKWGGILRDVELEATPQTFIDDAWARGDFDRHVCEVHVETAGAASAASVRVNVEGEVADVPVARDGGETVVTLPLRNFRLWSPEHPNLYTAAVELVMGGQVVHTRR